MSYTTFSHNCMTTALTSSLANFSCTVKNTGPRVGDEVLQVYHRVSDSLRSSLSHPVPLRRLVDFERLRLAEGAEVTTSFSLPLRSFSLTNAAGDYELHPGKHEILFSRGAAETVVEVDIHQHKLYRNAHPNSAEHMTILV